MTLLYICAAALAAAGLAVVVIYEKSAVYREDVKDDAPEYTDI